MNPQEETQHQQQSGPTCARVSSFLGHHAGRCWIILDSFLFLFFLSALTPVLGTVFNTRQMERYEIPFCLVAWGVIKPANLKCVLSAYLTSDIFSGVSPKFLGSILAAFERWRTGCLCVVTQAFFTVQSSGSKSSEELGFHFWQSAHFSLSLYGWVIVQAEL